jgi:ribosomal protein S27AE
MMILADMQRKKIDLTKVLESLNTVCPACGFSISADKLRRIDFTRMQCLKCEALFAAGKPPGAKREFVRKAD